MRTAPRTWGTRRSAALSGCCSASISASRRTQSMATAASRGPWSCLRATTARSRRPWAAFQTGDSGSVAAMSMWIAPMPRTRSQAVITGFGVHQATSAAIAAPAGMRASACGVRRRWPRRESSWAICGRTSRTAPAPRPTMLAPTRTQGPGKRAAPMEAGTMSIPAPRLTGLRPRWSLGQRAARAPSAMPSPRAMTSAGTPSARVPRLTAMTPSTAPSMRPASHAPARRRNGPGARETLAPGRVEDEPLISCTPSRSASRAPRGSRTSSRARPSCRRAASPH